MTYIAASLRSVLTASLAVALGAPFFAQRATFELLNLDDPTIGLRAISWSLGDYDSDGDGDLIYVSRSEQQLRIMTNDGGQVRLDGRLWADSFSSRRVAKFTPIDADQDGDLDLFFFEYGGAPSSLDHSIAWNDGAAGFTSSPLTTVPPTNLASIQLLPADLNGDSLVDVLSISGGNQNRIFFADGTGNFVNVHGAVTGILGQSGFASLGDLDLDGDIDVIASRNPGDSVEFHNNGVGTFTQVSIVPGSVRALGDMDQDGDLDPVGHRQIFVNDGTASYTAAPFYSGLPSDGLYAMVLGDVDGDGDLDIFGHNAVSGMPGDRRLLLNDGSNSMSQAPSFTSLRGRGDGPLALTDWTGNGSLDLLVQALTQVELHRGNGTGDFLRREAKLDSLAVDAMRVIHGDLNHDDFPDLLLSGFLHADPNVSADFLAYGQADGTMVLSDPQNLLVPISVPLLVDLNGDGLDDLVQVTGIIGDGDWLSLSTGVGTFAPTQLVADFVASPRSVHAGDMDDDGDLDLVCLGYQTTRLWLNDGAGRMTEQAGSFPPISGGNSADSASIADVDGDGDLDVFVAGLQSAMFFNDGVGFFTRAQVLTTFNVQAPISGDVDADGDIDFLVQAPLLDANQLLLNQGDGTFQVSLFNSSSQSTVPIGLGDFDRDGSLDLLLGGSTERLLIMEWDGTTFVSNDEPAPQWGVLLREGRLIDTDGDGDDDLLGATGAHATRRFLVYNNLDRQLVSRTAPILGSVAEFSVYGRAMTPWLLAGSATTIQATIGTLGSLYLPFPNVLLLGQGVLPTEDVVHVPVPIPAALALAGVKVHLQALIGFPPDSLSNLLTIELVDF